MKNINPTELKKRLDNNEILLIDVREPIEHKNEHIEGSCLIPLNEINVKKLPSTKKPIVIHCGCGQRSANACEKLLAEDPALDLYSLEGGIIAWQQAGFNVTKPGANILPLERQTQIAIGVIIFFSTIFGFIISSGFFILLGFMGIALILAGITGWCGIANLLAKMPWNKLNT